MGVIENIEYDGPLYKVQRTVLCIFLSSKKA